MKWYWFVLYGLAGAVMIFDFVLELKGKKTLSEYVWQSSIPNWLWYILILVLLNAIFWFVSPWVAGLVLLGSLLGHFAR